MAPEKAPIELNEADVARVKKMWKTLKIFESLNLVATEPTTMEFEFYPKSFCWTLVVSADKFATFSSSISEGTQVRKIPPKSALAKLAKTLNERLVNSRLSDEIERHLDCQKAIAVELTNNPLQFRTLKPAGIIADCCALDVLEPWASLLVLDVQLRLGFRVPKNLNPFIGPNFRLGFNKRISHSAKPYKARKSLATR